MVKQHANERRYACGIQEPIDPRHMTKDIVPADAIAAKTAAETGKSSRSPAKIAATSTALQPDTQRLNRRQTMSLFTRKRAQILARADAIADAPDKASFTESLIVVAAILIVSTDCLILALRTLLIWLTSPLKRGRNQPKHRKPR